MRNRINKKKKDTIRFKRPNLHMFKTISQFWGTINISTVNKIDVKKLNKALLPQRPLFFSFENIKPKNK